MGVAEVIRSSAAKRGEFFRITGDFVRCFLECKKSLLPYIDCVGQSYKHILRKAA